MDIKYCCSGCWAGLDEDTDGDRDDANICDDIPLLLFDSEGEAEERADRMSDVANCVRPVDPKSAMLQLPLVLLLLLRCS